MSVYYETVDGKLMPIIKNNILHRITDNDNRWGGQSCLIAIAKLPLPYHVIFFTIWECLN